MARYRLPGEESETKSKKRDKREKSLCWVRILKEKMSN